MEISYIFLIICLTLEYCLAKSSTYNITTDQSSLLSLKEHFTLDPHKFLSSNWSSSSSSVCQWRGVTCSSRHSRVTSLDLSNMNLTGTIPPHLGNLSFLLSLDLSSNYFHGTLPLELSRLRRLQVLNLKTNSFTGFIPPSIFMNLTNLEDLRLSFNSLKGPIPRQIGNLGRLKILTLALNQLSGSLPIELFNITSLRVLSLGENALFGTLLPDYEYSCDNLRYLDLINTKLYGPILSILSNCSQLQILSLSETNFGGVIPQEIGNLKALQELYLADNNLTGKIPGEIFNISSLELINLSNNGISDSLPDNMCDSLPRLKKLGIIFNRLYGQIPSNLSRCSQLEQLHLLGNELHGLIPKEISNLKNLLVLNLALNNLQGTIPREIGKLYNLQRLRLDHNNLRGPMPMDDLATCKNLREFVVSGNPLISGFLPDSVGNLSRNIQAFGVSNCQIKGSIPDTIGNLTNLVVLDLSWNGLSGLIPSTIKFLQKLQSLNLERNNLNGDIMIDRVCGLQSLSEVNMQYNEISGLIPECLENLLSLRHLSLSSNKLNGSVPVSLWKLRDLLELNLSTNFLSGSLPPEFGNMKAAILIDLSVNNILGSIPMSIGYLQNIQILDIAYNKIQGSIHKTIGEMVSLESLDLSHNGLSGLIPNTLEKLLYLKHFDVSFNDLSGEIPNGGSFQNFTSESFSFNGGLYGEQRFHIPPCPSRSNKRKVPRIVIVLIGIATFLGALLSVFVYLRYRKKNTAGNEIILLPPVRTHERISHDELVQATEGYHEKNLLGKGSFASVYKGILGDGRIVAVKLFNLQFEKASKSFDVECMVLRELRHRHLVKVITSCSSPNFKALVLEFMTNGSLGQWLNSEYCFLNFMQRLNVMIDVAYALNYLHSGYSSSIAHCDLKPSNILLDEDMVAHVSDFGIAKLLGHEDSMTYTQTLATLGYLAPEYGLQGTISTKCDVYSYGIILMEVFTGKKPDGDMFEENLDLRAWVDNAVPNSLASIIDANLLRADGMNSENEIKCLLSIMKIALNCTRGSPKERCTMAEVVAELEKIKIQLDHAL